MFNVDKAMESHKWDFGYDDDEVQEFHDNLMRFLDRNREHVKNIQIKHNRTFNMPYFRTNKIKPDEK